MGFIFTVIGVAAVFIWLFWLATEKFPKVGDKIKELGNKAHSCCKSLFKKKDKKKKEEVVLNE